MPSHTLTSLIASTNQRLEHSPLMARGEPGDVLITHITIDSRQARPGTLFVALEGARTDGHRFINAAVEQGASAVLVNAARVEEAAHLSIPVITAPNTRAHLGDVARVFYDDPFNKIRAVIGVTGTNGKTTSTYIAESLLSQAGIRVGVIGTITYRWGNTVIPAPNTTPESLVLYDLASRMVSDGVEVLLMEVSSHGLETHRLNGVKCDAAVFTNFTQDHLDFHGSMEAYCAAKRKLFFAHLATDGVAVLNLDDPVGERWARELVAERADVYGFSCESSLKNIQGVDVLRVSRIDATLEGSEVHVEGEATPWTIPLLGEFNVANVLGMMRALEGLGVMSREALNLAMPKLSAVPGRLQRVNPGAQPAVFVDYAHSPDALEHVLKTLRPCTEGALRVVFGCGGDRDRGKRAIMGRVAVERADHVLLTSDNPRSEPPMQIIEHIIEGTAHRGDRVEVEPDRALAIRAAIMSACTDDVVLVAGKGHETYQELATGRIDFDDVKVALDALATRRKAGSPA